MQHENTIICIQEHFLWDFEKDFIQSIMPTMSYHIRCHDHLEPLSGFKLPRGRGGVAILWPKAWASKVKRLDEGNERIVAVTIAASKPICLINAYLPTHDSGSHTEYLECLDIIHSIFIKYQGTYEVILCGDLNGTLLETRSNKHDKSLRNFTAELQLSTGIACGTTPTFYHHAGNSTSQIDYILVQNKQLILLYKVLDKSPICSSAHVTVLANLNITLPCASQAVNQRQNKVTKLNWDRADQH
ncbi:MAG: hypothetical protein JAZ10_20495 [Candidatus Thiodiazotropha endolucinida]|nr:hypothetical protein [Candidatus Thiodiazotropha taylori]